jgi:hypothetical protein
MGNVPDRGSMSHAAKVKIFPNVTGGFMKFGPFLGLAIILCILWIGGFLMFHVAGFFIHLLLIFAVISLVIHLVSGRSTS